MEQYYYIQKKGKKLGPYKLSHFSNLVVFSDDLIWRNDKDQWLEAKIYDEFKDIIVEKPPATNYEVILAKFHRGLIRKGKWLLVFYIAACIILSILSYILALSSFRNANGPWNRYEYFNPSYTFKETEAAAGNNQSFLFSAFRPIFSTYYLESTEQKDSTVLFMNISMSSFASLSIIFIAIGLIYYIAKRVKLKIIN